MCFVLCVIDLPRCMLLLYYRVVVVFVQLHATGAELKALSNCVVKEWRQSIIQT